MEPHGVIIRTRKSQRMVQTMNNDSAVTRRDFLKKSAKTGAGLAALGGITLITEPERVFGAGDRVQVAIIGLNGRGSDHMKELSRLAEAPDAALFDVGSQVLDQRFGPIG